MSGGNEGHNDVIGQGRALGDPTRYRIFEHLRLQSHPQTISDLTQAFELHPNAIRSHLGVLRDAGLVIEERAAPTGRGRPAMLYRLSPGAIERWEATGPAEELSLMLLEIIQTSRPPREVGFEAGRRLGRELEGGAESDAVEAMVGVARRLGFEPILDEGDIVLRHCPFAAGAERAPEVICTLHQGLIEGVAHTVDDGTRIDGLNIRNPRRAGCRVLLTHPDPSRHRATSPNDDPRA